MLHFESNTQYPWSSSLDSEGGIMHSPGPSSLSPASSLASDSVLPNGGEKPKKQLLYLLDLPPEILESIISYLPFEVVAKMRRVCQNFNGTCSAMLNSEFHRLRMSTQQRFHNIKAQMPRRESARRKHPLARESDIIETLHMRLTLLHMTFGKHIERKHCCFFAGEILDEVHRILRYVKTTPNLSRTYKVTDELFDLSTMAMEYFKENIEPTLPEITYFVSDFLDYTPSLSSSPKTQISLLEPSPSRSCSPTKSSVASFESESNTVSPNVQKRLRKLRENMKRNNGQVLALRQELRLTRRRMSNQQRQLQDMKCRFEDYDKKFQNTSKKLSAVLQELSRCKTELQYWRSKSPASQCSCGKITPVSELKDLDSFLEEYDNIDYSDISEDFKPISPEAEGSSQSRYSLFVPVAQVTPADCVHISPLDPASPSKEKPQHIDTEKINEDHERPRKLAPKACKRKLEMGEVNDAEVSAIKKFSVISHEGV